MASTSALPLKVRLAIRDRWDPADCPVQRSLASLRDLLGHDVEVEPEWRLLLADLAAADGVDKGRVVDVVAGCVAVWARALRELLEDEPRHAGWIEALLERLKAWSRLRLFVQVAPAAEGRGAAGTSWSSERAAFILTLPRKQIVDPAELYPVFSGGLLACFDEKKEVAGAAAAAAGAGAASSGAGDDWADVEVDTSTGTPDVKDTTLPIRAQPQSRQPSSPPSDSLPSSTLLPSATTLPRPDHLLLRPPYYLSVHAYSTSQIHLSSSHSPSLQLLADYLTRWCRVDHDDTRRPPAVKCTLHQSSFGGLGVMYDRLVLSVEDRAAHRFAVTAPMVLALVEGVLGYERVANGPGEWTFRRGTELKTA